MVLFLEDAWIKMFTFLENIFWDERKDGRDGEACWCSFGKLHHFVGFFCLIFWSRQNFTDEETILLYVVILTKF